MLKLNFDLARVRGTGYERPVRDLLRAIGEWDLLLDGAGVVPMEDFDRIAMFTANPRDLGKISIVGRHRHDQAWVRARTEQLARLRGQTAEWRQVDDIWRARWWARDGRERVVALLGQNTFAVCREEDLPTVVALSGNRQRGGNDLLSMNTNEVLRFQAESIASYVPRWVAGFGPLPRSGQLAVVLQSQHVEVDGLATYADEAGATDGASRWGEMTRNLATTGDNGIPGLARLLAGIRLQSESSEVLLDARMDLAQAYVLLGSLRSAFEDRRELQNLPPARYER